MDCTKRNLRNQILKIRRSFFQHKELPFNNILPRELLEQIVELGGSYRDKIFTPLITLRAFLWQVLSDNGSCKEAVANVLVERIEQGLRANSINSGPYCKARQRLPLTSMIQSVKSTGRVLHQQAETAWKQEVKGSSIITTVIILIRSYDT